MKDDQSDEELFETRLARFEGMVGDILTILHGEKNLRLIGLLDRMDLLKAEIQLEIAKLTTEVIANRKEIDELKTGSNKWRFILWGAIGGAVVVTAIYFGLSLNEIRKFIGK